MAPVALLSAIIIIGLSVQNFRLREAGCPCTNIEQATGNFETGEGQASFLGNPVVPPLAVLPEPLDSLRVLGEQAGEDKWIEIDLSEQKLRAWQGGQLFLETLVSTGKWAPTPTGEFRIWVKYKYTKMSGGSKAKNTYYYLPNVPYTMYFHNGYGLHGTYWHNNFGQRMSHGCVNLPTPMAERIFYWAGPVLVANQSSARASAENPGTRVIVHE